MNNTLNNLRIGLMGSASLGKSTTAMMLHQILGIEVHKELESRLIKKMVQKGEIKDKSSLLPSQSKAFQNRALRIRERLAKRNSFISDRTAGELWIYYQMYCGNFSSYDELKNFECRCLKVMKRYTYLFLFPFGQIPIIDNNYRNINENYQRQVHEKIEQMLSDLKLPYIQLEKNPLTREERTEEVLSWIRT